MWLPMEYRPDRILRIKLLKSYTRIEECHLARQNVATTVEGVIADLYTSMATATASVTNEKAGAFLTALYTTRRRFERYQKNDGGDRLWKKKHKMKDEFLSFSKDQQFRAFIADALLSDDSDNDEEEDASDEPYALAVQLDGLLDLLKEDEEEPSEG